MDDERQDRQQGEQLSLKVVDTIHRVPAAAWDACAGAAASNHNPFVSFAFLSALEDSGAVSAETGWQPQHVVLENQHGQVLGCAPLYLKNHSYGEYIFDWAWAQAFERAGGAYYPKLQCAVPFTPATGPRLLVNPELDDATRRERQLALMAGMTELARRYEVSSLHVTFPTAPEHALMAEAGFLARLSEQYHWKNEGYANFDDFLGALASRKRKAIRREREKANAHGVAITTLTGAEVTGRHWDAFFRFYIHTADRKWGRPYLNREFFTLIGERMAEAVVLMVGEEDGRLVCGALNFKGGDTLFGRNWGTLVDYPLLHFELCYYRAMDFAIAHRLAWVEAGAQGEHKVQRGYLPRATYSSHWIADPGLRQAIARYLAAERAEVTADLAADHGPFKK